MPAETSYSVPPHDAPSLLITAGPTREPIDAVRFLGNRSSGRMGVAIAAAAVNAGWRVTLLLGPTEVRPEARPGLEVIPFESTADLEALLREHLDSCDILIMAAAVSDYRPVVSDDNLAGKHRRGDTALELRLEPTPDLLAGCAAKRRPDQLLVGFALEPLDRLESSAKRKLEKKRIDLIVANPLETMGSDAVDARLYAAPAMQSLGLPALTTPEQGITKPDFARWLVEQAGHALDLRTRAAAVETS